MLSTNKHVHTHTHTHTNVAIGTKECDKLQDEISLKLDLFFSDLCTYYKWYYRSGQEMLARMDLTFEDSIST